MLPAEARRPDHPAPAELEAAARKQLQAKNQNLESYRSEFFGKVSQILAGLPGVKVVGDRFVFSSEVLFPPASAALSDAGKAQIDKVVVILEQVAAQIPKGINWILQVNGYTDATPLSGNGPYKDNWELSQARALSVVRYMISKGFDAQRLAATERGARGQSRPGHHVGVLEQLEHRRHPPRLAGERAGGRHGHDRHVGAGVAVPGEQLAHLELDEPGQPRGVAR